MTGYRELSVTPLSQDHRPSCMGPKSSATALMCVAYSSRDLGRGMTPDVVMLASCVLRTWKPQKGPKAAVTHAT